MAQLASRQPWSMIRFAVIVRPTVLSSNSRGSGWRVRCRLSLTATVDSSRLEALVLTFRRNLKTNAKDSGQREIDDEKIFEFYTVGLDRDSLGLLSAVDSRS